ncbi:MAG: TIR domain-containing protein, partial [Pseudomonadota bacterium]
MPQFDTFISYAHNDGSQSADKIRDFLATRNLRVWKDEQLRLGEEIDKTIRGAIDNSASMLVVLTDTAIDSQYVQREVKYAKDKGIRVVPVILKPTKFSASKKWKEIFSEVNWGRVDQNAETRYLTDRVLADVYRSLQNKSGRDKPVLAFYNFKGGVGKT